MQVFKLALATLLLTSIGCAAKSSAKMVDPSDYDGVAAVALAMTTMPGAEVTSDDHQDPPRATTEIEIATSDEVEKACASIDQLAKADGHCSSGHCSPSHAAHAHSHHGHDHGHHAHSHHGHHHHGTVVYSHRGHRARHFRPVRRLFGRIFCRRGRCR